MHERFLNRHLENHGVRTEQVSSAAIAVLNQTPVTPGRELIVVRAKDGIGLVAGKIESDMHGDLSTNILESALREWNEETRSNQRNNWEFNRLLNRDTFFIPPLLMRNKSNNKVGAVFPVLINDSSIQGGRGLLESVYLDEDVVYVFSIDLHKFLELPEKRIRRPEYNTTAARWMLELSDRFDGSSLLTRALLLSFNSTAPHLERKLIDTLRPIFRKRITNIIENYYIEV